MDIELRGYYDRLTHLLVSSCILQERGGWGGWRLMNNNIPNYETKILPSYNYWLKRLYTQPSEQSNQNFIKVLKVVEANECKKVIITLWGLV